MQKNILVRINELAKKSKETKLSESELLEQQTLRTEYVAAYRASLKNTLDSIVVVDKNGTQTKVMPKEKQNEKA